MEGYIGTLQEKGYTIPRHLNGLAGMQLNNIRYKLYCFFYCSYFLFCRIIAYRREWFQHCCILCNCLIFDFVFNRGGIGATLGAIGAQLPYPYVHLVYWTVQCLLGITAIQQGCDAGVKYYSKINGTFLFCCFVSILDIFFVVLLVEESVLCAVFCTICSFLSTLFSKFML